MTSRESESILSARRLQLPEYLGALKLKGHQYDPTIMLLRPHIRGILAFYRVGSGKTASAILAAVVLMQRKVVRNVVILTPASLRQNFIDEIKRTVLDPYSQKQLISNVYSIQAPNKIPTEKVVGSLLIIDEVHNLRSEGARFDIIRQLTTKSAKNLLLTATPVYNYPPDIFPLLLLTDGKLIRDKLFDDNLKQKDAQSTFRKEFGPYGTGKISPQGVKSNEPIIQDLRPLLACSILYYEPTAADKQYYPKVKDRDVRIPMTEIQGNVHKSLAKKQQQGGNGSGDMTLEQFEQTLLNGGSLSSLSSYLAKYRMLGNAAMVRPTIMAVSKKTGKIYRKKGSVISIESGKVPHIVESIIRMLNKKTITGKAVVYSEFIELGLDLIKNELTTRDIPFGIFSGSVSIAQKNKYVKDYNEDKLRILLISKAGAEGLTLKNTTELHIMEPGWNEEGVRQVIGRVSRFQSHTRKPQLVNVYRYVSIYPPGMVDTESSQRQSLMMTGTADERLRSITKHKEKKNRHFLNLIIKLAQASVKQCRAVNDKWYNTPYYNFSNSNRNNNNNNKRVISNSNGNSNNNVPLSKRIVPGIARPMRSSSSALIAVPTSPTLRRSKKRRRASSSSSSYLKISSTNTDQMVKRKYRKLAKMYHPNKGGRVENFIQLQDELKKWLDKNKKPKLKSRKKRLEYGPFGRSL